MSNSGRTLRDLCELIVDCEHRTAPLAKEGYPSIRTPNVGRGRLILDGVNRVDEAMLETLKREKLVLDWRLKERAKAAVRSAIQQALDALPPAYDDDLWQGKVAQTYEWVFDHYPGGDA